MTPRRWAKRAVLGWLVIAFAGAPFMVPSAHSTAFSFISFPPGTDGPWRTAAGSTQLAQSFVAPSGDYEVTSVSLLIRNADESNSSSSASTYTVTVQSSVAGAPGSVLATAVSNRSIGQWGAEEEVFTLGTPLALTAGATYFVVLTGSLGGTVGWKCASSPTTDVSPTPVFTALRSTDGGSSWSAPSLTCAGSSFITRVTGAVVPPTTTTSTTTTTVLPATTTSTVTRPTISAATTSTTVASSGTSTTTSSTIARSQTSSDNDEPSPRPASPFSDDEATEVVARMDADIGDPAGGSTITVRAVSLVPSSSVTVTVYSDPVVLLNARASSDGTFAGTAELPFALESGMHTIVVDAVTSTGPTTVAGAFQLDDSGTITGAVQPAAIEDFRGPDDARLARALANGRPVYDPRSRPLTSASLVVGATAMLALAGAGGLGGFSGSSAAAGRMSTGSSASSGGRDGEGNSNSPGRLANVVTKKLKSLGADGSGAGDASRTWRVPGTVRTDSSINTWAGRAGRWSSMAPRIIVDGAWLRAMFGAAGLSPWVLGAAISVGSAISASGSVLVPSFAVIAAIVVLGTLDAGAGAVGWISLLISALVAGDMAGWADVRTALGIGVLAATIPLLAHVIRPLRRSVSSTFDRTERLLDYVIMPVFVAFAAGSMLKALNGLSGLEIATRSNISDMRWVVGVAIVVRLAGEDLVARFYPARMAAAQPEKLSSPGRIPTSVAIVVRSLVFLMVAEPFFGLSAVTVVAMVLLAAPRVIKMWEDDLPNSARLNRWLPRGHAQFFCLLVIGSWLTASLIGPSKDPDAIRSSFVWLLLPGVVVGVTELFGRHGGQWPNVLMKRTVGAVTWTVAVSMVTGWFTPFS